MQAPQEIQPAILLKHLTEHDVVRAGNTVCVICLKTFSLGEYAASLICQHVYHGEYIRLWFENVA